MANAQHCAFCLQTPLVCSACHESFTCKDAVTKHLLEAHYNLARVNDERPLSLKEMRSALLLASATVKRFTCLQPECGVSFAAYKSYYVHLSRCGPFVGIFDKEDNEEPVQEPEAEASPTGKRLSALRALASFQTMGEPAKDKGADADSSVDSDFTPSFDGGDDQDGSEEYTSGDEEPEVPETEPRDPMRRAPAILRKAWHGKYEEPPPLDGATVEPELVASWTKALAENRTIQCPKEDCAKRFQTVMGLHYHYRRCGKKQLYRCLNCSTATFARAKTMLKHLRLCYPERPEADPVESVCIPFDDGRRRRLFQSSLLASMRLPLLPFGGANTLLLWLHRRMHHL
ncbi:hypothetical protein V5799_004288 [Amblyomma americanum]|uniref:C2H2-type domain-containing protein n=1 Tax=Amblyomma americanum TaxID=6943 RepID=A0AAQ4D6J0_AMBAM